MKFSFRNPLRRPTPEEMIARQLADAELHRLQAAAGLEQAAAYLEMLTKRVARLRKELTAAAREVQP